MAGYIASMRPGDVVCASREARYKNLRDELSQLDTPVDLNIGSAYGSTRDVSQGMRDIAGVVANVFAYTSIAGAALFYALTSGSADAKQMPIVVGDKRLQHPSALVEREDGVGDGPDPKGLDGRLLALQQETTGLEAPDIASISIEDRTQVVPGQNLKVRVSAESIYTNISNVEVYLDVMDDSPEQNAKNFGQGNVLNSYPIEVSLPSDLEYGQHEIYVRVVDTNGEHSTAVKRFVVVDPATVVERDHIPKKPQVTIEVQGEDGNFYDPQELGWENKTYEPGDVITFRVTASDPDGIRRMSAEVHDSQRDESTRLDRLETISYGPGERENVQPQVSVISQWTVPEGIAASADLEQSLYWITVRAYDTREMSDVSQDLTFRVSRPSDAVAAGDIDWDGTEDDGDVGASGDYDQSDLAPVDQDLQDALDQSDQLVEGTGLPVDDRSVVGVDPEVTVYDLTGRIHFDANDGDSDILGYSLHLLDADRNVLYEVYHDSK